MRGVEGQRLVERTDGDAEMVDFPMLRFAARAQSASARFEIVNKFPNAGAVDSDGAIDRGIRQPPYLRFRAAFVPPRAGPPC